MFQCEIDSAVRPIVCCCQLQRFQEQKKNKRLITLIFLLGYYSQFTAPRLSVNETKSTMGIFFTAFRGRFFVEGCINNKCGIKVGRTCAYSTVHFHAQKVVQKNKSHLAPGPISWKFFLKFSRTLLQRIQISLTFTDFTKYISIFPSNSCENTKMSCTMYLLKVN